MMFKKFRVREIKTKYPFDVVGTFQDRNNDCFFVLANPKNGKIIYVNALNFKDEYHYELEVY